ncbi:hypothetical protein EVAR_8332_1 [Eumeta japonica]|uniref:Uncharacterized protein n=1 Tax=Eumeta variegata TaxID=151549 RepID=A0A4C1VD15_EUMVA|nr:hypothetical protein EVAR_8332_1 [Eumeta japonica]
MESIADLSIETENYRAYVRIDITKSVFVRFRAVFEQKNFACDEFIILFSKALKNTAAESFTAVHRVHPAGPVHGDTIISLLYRKTMGFREIP